MTESDLHLRRLRACLAVGMFYLLFASLALLARAEAHRWGIMLAPWQRRTLWCVLSWHVGGAAGLALLLVVSRTRRRITARWSRLALAAMPVLVLASVDRLATIGYRPVREIKGLFQPHPVRLWTSRPGWKESRGRVKYHINSGGLRGPDIPLDKPEGERRILFLGDSVTFGWRLNEEDCFVQKVARFAAERAGGKRLSVINCSVVAYSPWQEYDLLKEVGLRYDPDVVVQVFCLNDIGQKFNLVRYGGATRELARPQPSALEWSGLYRWIRALAVKGFGPTREELARRKRGYSADRAIDEPEAPAVAHAWEITLESLRRLAALSRANGLPLAIVCFPLARQIDADASECPAPQQRLAAFCEKANVPFLDLLPVYRVYCRELRVPGLAMLPDGVHPSPVGNTVAARAIRNFLSDLGWLD